MITIGNEKLEAFINNELEAKLIKLHKKQPLELYWDYRDEISPSQIDIIINNEDGWNEVSNEIIDNNNDNAYDLQIERLSNTLNEYCQNNEIRFLDCKEIAEEIIDEFRDYMEVDYNLKELFDKIKPVPIRIVRYSNYDCINSHSFEGVYSYEESYFGDTVNVLNLNPKKVKQALLENSIDVVGKWPDKYRRNGKEFINYNDFIVEVENRTCPACLIVITGMLNINQIRKEHNRIDIPKGNKVGFFSSSHGGGSMIDAELIKDISINTKPGKTEYDHWELVLDDADGYSIKETYGVSKSFFGKEVKLSKTK